MSDAPLISAAHKHLGRPWNGHSFDCWGCVRAVYADAFGIVLPVYQITGENTRREISEAITGNLPLSWVEVFRPVDGCLAILGKREWPHHVGVYLGTGHIVHCLEAVGCTIDSVSMLKRNGWGYMRFYRLNNKP